MVQKEFLGFRFHFLKTPQKKKHSIIAGLCYLYWFVAYCMLKYSKEPMHYRLHIIPKHFERVFRALPFISIQNPAMNKSIRSKISSSSQWNSLFSLSWSMGCGMPSGDDKEKHNVISLIMLCITVYSTILIWLHWRYWMSTELSWMKTSLFFCRTA